MTATIIAVGHHAGGVGKTTTALNLGYSLVQAGRRVLLVDLDPQADLSDRLGLEPPAGTDLAGALVRGLDPPLVTTEHGFDVIPSSLDTMAGVELALSQVYERERRVRVLLAELVPAYDYILLDCPPNLTLLTANAFYAADAVLIPVEAQPKAYRHLGNLRDMLGDVQRLRGGAPRVLGYLLTKVDRTLAARQVEEALRADAGPLAFTATIRRGTRLTEDSAYGGPVGWYAPANGTAQDYTDLAEEVITRVEAD